MALPLPSLSFTGGTAGPSESGDIRAQTPTGISFGAFNVGGAGTRQGGATTSAGAAESALPPWFWPAALGSLVFLAALWLILRRKR